MESLQLWSRSSASARGGCRRGSFCRERRPDLSLRQGDLAGRFTTEQGALGEDRRAGCCCVCCCRAPVTTATFSQPGDYELALEATGKQSSAARDQGACGTRAACRSSQRGLYAQLLNRRPILERTRKGSHRELDSSLHRHVRAHRYSRDARRWRNRQLHRGGKSEPRRSAWTSTRDMCFPMRGFTRLSSPCVLP